MSHEVATAVANYSVSKFRKGASGNSKKSTSTTNHQIDTGFSILGINSLKKLLYLINRDLDIIL